MEEQKKKKSIKREIIEWAIFLGVFAGLYFSGLHTPVIGFIQRGILATGIISPNTNVDKRLASYDMRLVDISGNEVDLSTWKSETIFLNFWATWCPPCIAEMPDIDDLYKEMGNEVQFALISVDKDPEKAIKFVEDKGFQAPIFFMASGIPEAYRSSAIPTTFVISPEGEIVAMNQGMAKYNTKKFRNFLRELDAK